MNKGNYHKKIRDCKISDFLDNLSSKSPTPGGGAVAAIVGAMGASLVKMVCNLTIGKKNYAKVESSMQKVVFEADKYEKELLILADCDVEAFDGVMQAYRSKDNESIRKALEKAIEVPTRVKILAEKIEGLAIGVSKKGNKNAYSDALTAVYLSHAAIDSADENIEINKKALASLK